MPTTRIQRRVNILLGASVAFICAGMVLVNLSRGTYPMAAILALVVLILVLDLVAALRLQRLPVSINLVLCLIGAAIVLGIWLIGPETGFYAFPAVIGAFLVSRGLFPLVFSLIFCGGVVSMTLFSGGDWPFAMRLFFALSLCLAFLWYAAIRIDEAQNQLVSGCIRDPLTGCFNRRHLEAVTEIEDLSDAALILFDLDDFKSVNDNLGHPTGDYVLKAVTMLVQQELGPGDLLFRLGGEEFLVLRPCGDLASARALAERCRAQLEGSGILKMRRITATFSCAAIAGQADLMPALCRADVMLLRAKRDGRNRVA